MKPMKKMLVTLFHPGPIATLLLIKTITLSVIYLSLMWWNPTTTGGLICLASFLTCSGLTMYNFFSAILFGPGFIPRGWKPKEEEAHKKLQFCFPCSGFKVPRSHHCRQCERCIMKMDHHCPWLNTCVGHTNHTNFIGFLSFAIAGCSEAVVILSCSLYHAVYRNYYLFYGIDAPIVSLSMYGFVWCLFNLGCSFGVAFGCSLLLFYQLRIVWKNCTSIEEWITEKAYFRRSRNPELPPFIYPYNLGWKRNIQMVLNWSCEPIGDGITWPLADGCSDQYLLTVEQLDQKYEKRVRTKEYTVVENYNGSWCPISKGFGPLFHPPCSDETRIKLVKGDRILVSRWKKYWLYGERLTHSNSDESDEKLKGWFPRRGAIEVLNSFHQNQHSGPGAEEAVHNSDPFNHNLNSKKQE